MPRGDSSCRGERNPARSPPGPRPCHRAREQLPRVTPLHFFSSCYHQRRRSDTTAGEGGLRVSRPPARLNFLFQLRLSTFELITQRIQLAYGVKIGLHVDGADLRRVTPTTNLMSLHYPRWRRKNGTGGEPEERGIEKEKGLQPHSTWQ